jgi:hypothetical protein
MNETQLTDDAKQQLNEVNIRPYTSFLSDLLVLADEDDISTLWISSSASQAIFSRIPAEKRLIASKI